MQYSPSLNTSSVWLPVFAEGWEQNASQTSDSGAQVSLSFQGTNELWSHVGFDGAFPKGTSVRLLAFAVKNSSFSELNVTVDDQLFMLPGQTIGDEDLYFDLPLGPSKLNPSTYHTVATQKSSVAANDSFWSIVAFIISDQTSSDSEPSSISSEYHEINLKVLLGAIISALSIGVVVAFLFLHRRRRWYRELARRVVPDPLSASAEQGRLRSSWRSGSSLFSFRRYASSKASAAATLNTTESGKENSQRGQWPDFPGLSPQIEAKPPHPASGRSVYISRDGPLQDSGKFAFFPLFASRKSLQTVQKLWSIESQCSVSLRSVCWNET
ncbi:hypothetical protein ACEPAF_8660 [Sanghuangporus sanghuang]